MNLYTFERKQVIDTDIETAWRFFSDPANLVKITPKDMDFRITSPLVDEICGGEIITYTVRPLFGIKVNWVTEITHLQKPHFFVDEQRFGPYRFWHHQHRFREVDGGIEVHDTVSYMLLHEQLATIVNAIFVAPRLKKIFDHRENAINTIFSKGE